jgi:hypothetical protein
MRKTEVSPRWKTLVAVFAAALVLAGCRKSETATASAPAVTASSEALRHPPFGFLEVPRENDAVAAGTVATGWALDDSGIAGVSVSLDNGPPLAATLGQAFPGVKEAYPTFPASDKAGFRFAMPSVAAGPHLLVVTITARDGGKTDIKRHIQIK